MAYFRSASDSDEDDEEYLRDYLGRLDPFTDDYSDDFHPDMPDAAYFRDSGDAVTQDYFRTLLDSVEPHQYISLGVLLAVHVGDVLTLKEKDTNTIRELLMKLFADWLTRQKKESNPRTILAQKLRTFGLNSQADVTLDSKAVGGRY